MAATRGWTTWLIMFPMLVGEMTPVGSKCTLLPTGIGFPRRPVALVAGVASKAARMSSSSASGDLGDEAGGLLFPVFGVPARERLRVLDAGVFSGG